MLYNLIDSSIDKNDLSMIVNLFSSYMCDTVYRYMLCDLWLEYNKNDFLTALFIGFVRKREHLLPSELIENSYLFN